MNLNDIGTFRIILSVVCLFLFSPGCQRDTEQTKVRNIITDVQRAVEEKDIRTILGHLSRTYRDPQGYDYNGIKGLLLSYFFRYQKISVYITNLDVTADAIPARATFQAVLSSSDKTGSAADILPEALGVYVFNVVFSKESKEWKVVSSTWEPLGETPARKSQ